MEEIEYDAMGPITAYRGWVQHHGELRAITVGKPWVPGEAAQHEIIGISVASLLTPSSHVSPHLGCTCGYYALKEPESLGGMLGAVNGTVLGEVELWGKVIEHEFGYRAQYTRVKRLFAIYKPGVVWIPSADVVKNYGAEMVVDEEDPVLARILKALEDPFHGMVFLTNNFVFGGATTYNVSSSYTTTTSSTNTTTSGPFTIKWDVNDLGKVGQ